MDWNAHHGDHFRGARCLVTGGAGFIGSHIIEALVSLGAEVVALDDLSGGEWNNLDGFDDSVRTVTGSILDTDTLADCTAGCRYVFHEAALGSVPESVEMPVQYNQVNTNGTVNVLEAARQAGVQRVIYAGSSSAYGDPPDDGPKLEDMPVLPRSPYAAAKLAGEHMMRAWSLSYGIDTAVTRYFNIFGPRQNANSSYAAVIAAFATALLNNQAPTIYGDGEQCRDFTYVHNAVQANLLAARCDKPLEGEVFNTACAYSISINELYEKIAAQLGRQDLRPTYAEARAGDVRMSTANINKANKTIGYEPLVDFDTGLNTTVEWYRKVLTGTPAG